MNISLIKPKHNGKSDKYSWQLYQYIVKNFKHTKDLKNIQVFFNNQDRFSGEKIAFNKDDIRLSQIVVGTRHNTDRDKVVSGNNLSTIMGASKNKYTSWSYHPIAGWENEQFEDITVWFWDEYIKLGRCLFDKGHNGWWQGEEDRFIYVNNTRRCDWCGQWQEKKIDKVVKIERKIKWINQVGIYKGE